MQKINPDQDVLKNQIITYLGNKRHLIGFIDEAVNNIIANDDDLKQKQTNDIRFFDIFSGSGVVSRYAKLKGFQVYSNDLEIYSEVINKTFLYYDNSIAQKNFSQVIKHINNQTSYTIQTTHDSYQDILDFLNQLTSPEKSNNFYFSIYYAPKDTQNPDFNNERLFYTQENALKIDAIVEWIFDNNLFNEITKNIILTSLMYNMTCHINTSGTMKGYHNGWGGKGQAALQRILSPIYLEKLPLIDNGQKPNYVVSDYAEQVFENHNMETMDIVYADPPYNQHQYSANYNHLTTLVKNDHYYPGPVKQGSRSGIRTDHTRSDFCKSTKDTQTKKKKSEIAFRDFIQNVKTKYIIMSYNNEGVVDIATLLEILSQQQKNSITVHYRPYDKYKGGKATKTSTKVVEYLIIVTMNQSQTKQEFEQIKTDLYIVTQKNLFSDRYINYNNFEHKKENKSIILLHNNQPIAVVDPVTYKLKEDYLNHYDDVELVKMLLANELNKIQLAEQYIEDGNFSLAQKLINNFNNQSMQKEKIRLLSKMNNN